MTKLIFCLLLLSAPLRATPILQFNIEGQLIGANNILIFGDLFDVRFLDGTFTDIFGDASGLDATTPQHGLAFSTALAEQVFNSNNLAYDEDSGKTLGCSNSWRAYCYIYTPWNDIVGQQLSVSYFLNLNEATYNRLNQFDSVGHTATGRWVNTSSYSFTHGDYVYADWSASLTGNSTSIPEPPSILLLLAALLIINRKLFSYCRLC